MSRLEEAVLQGELSSLYLAFLGPAGVRCRCRRCQAARPGKAEFAFVFICGHPVLCFEMSVKTRKMPPAHQAFNRVTAEIALNIAARFKRRRDRPTHRSRSPQTAFAVFNSPSVRPLSQYAPHLTLRITSDARKCALPVSTDLCDGALKATHPMAPVLISDPNSLLPHASPPAHPGF
jgi:hypothetical protein